MTSITIPASVTSIRDFAFSGCTSLTSIIILGDVETVGTLAFKDCTSLKSVTHCGKRVPNFGYGVFKECDNLKEITVTPDFEGDTFGGIRVIKSAAIGVTPVVDYSTEQHKEKAKEAATLLASGDCGAGGSNVKYKIYKYGNYAELVVSGKGAMKNYKDVAEIPWYGQIKNIKKLL